MTIEELGLGQREGVRDDVAAEEWSAILQGDRHASDIHLHQRVVRKVLPEIGPHQGPRVRNGTDDSIPRWCHVLGSATDATIEGEWREVVRAVQKVDGVTLERSERE